MVLFGCLFGYKSLKTGGHFSFGLCVRFWKMGVMGEAFTQLLIPVAALVGIGFALLQWLLVSKVKVSADSDLNNGYSDRLIEEEEEGIDHEDVAAKCAEIQNAISVGELSLSPSLWFEIPEVLWMGFG